MSTNIEIDDKLMADTLRATGLRTKREVIELGRRTLLRLHEQASLKLLRGRIDWQEDPESTRIGD
jgi:Arc/MetJ family transcription regulator